MNRKSDTQKTAALAAFRVEVTRDELRTIIRDELTQFIRRHLRERPQP